VVPSCLQGRRVQGQRSPFVTLFPATGGQTDEEEACKFRSMIAFLLAMEGGPKGEGMPYAMRVVFRVVLDLLMPAWDPLRRGVVGDGGQLHVG